MQVQRASSHVPVHLLGHRTQTQTKQSMIHFSGETGAATTERETQLVANFVPAAALAGVVSG